MVKPNNIPYPDANLTSLRLTKYNILLLRFFQHHRMYEFLFHSERTEEIVGTEVSRLQVQELTLPKYVGRYNEQINWYIQQILSHSKGS